jgi:hypothetical protein
LAFGVARYEQNVEAFPQPIVPSSIEIPPAPATRSGMMPRLNSVRLGTVGGYFSGQKARIGIELSAAFCVRLSKPPSPDSVLLNARKP